MGEEGEWEGVMLYGDGWGREDKQVRRKCVWEIFGAPRWGLEVIAASCREGRAS